MRVLVIEDDDAVQAALRRALLLANYDVTVAADGEQGLLRAASVVPDAIVLDVGLPRVNGLEVCRRLRAGGDRTPVLMLTARETVEDRVEGLEAGADDYLVKPYDVRELVARLRAIMRRHLEGVHDRSLRFGTLTLDSDAHAARAGEATVELTRTEFQLLELFMLNPRRVLPAAMIFDRVWGSEVDTSRSSLRVYIGYLRRKLKTLGVSEEIQTVHGVGYALRET